MDDLSVDVPEFRWPANTFRECNRILSHREQQAISLAAMMAHTNQPQLAEAARIEADYAGLD